MITEIPAVREIFKCRVCQSDKLTPLFSLGNQYVSNFLDPGEDPGIKCPIDLVLCENCTLVQLKHTAPQEILYSHKYWYRSGVTDTMRKALRNITEQIESLVELKKGDVILDLGSNDATLLRSYSKDGLIRVGVEPADNLATRENYRGLSLLHEFWNVQDADEFGWHIMDTDRGETAIFPLCKVITAIGMFYDLDDPNAFIADIAKALAPDGLFVAQLMTLRNMVEMNDVGNLAHEHLEFYSINSLQFMLSSHGLELFDIQTNNVNGQSDRLFIRHKGSKVAGPYRFGLAKVWEYVECEKTQLSKPSLDSMFARWETNKSKIRAFVKEAAYSGKNVTVYGASTKGNCLLQYWGLDNTLINCAAERSPEKWGKVTVGTDIPIVSEAEARARMPDLMLVLPYVFLSEFIEREKDEEWRKRGGRFIVPLPEMRLV